MVVVGLTESIIVCPNIQQRALMLIKYNRDLFPPCHPEAANGNAARRLSCLYLPLPVEEMGYYKALVIYLHTVLQANTLRHTAKEHIRSHGCTMAYSRVSH